MFLPPEAWGYRASSENFDKPHDEVGSRFKGAPEADRITQLFGDSRTFDYTDYLGQMQLVVIDGSHEYECVANDTANALRLVDSTGVIVWDDYDPQWSDVVRAVDGMSAREGRTVIHVQSTGLAILDPALANHQSRSPSWMTDIMSR
jgi:hypothetical protein